MNRRRLVLASIARRMIPVVLACGSAFWSCRCQAEGPTGIIALDSPAIAVKAPDKVVLIDIARAGGRLVAVGEHGVITYSDDNGLSWRQASVPVDVTLTAVRFATPNSGWAIGHYGVILHTSDGGSTWRMQLDGIQANRLTLQAAQEAVQNQEPFVGTPHALVRAAHFIEDGPDKPFLSMFAMDQNNALVFGAYRLAMRTSDGGRTWRDWSLRIADPISHNLYGAQPVGAGLCVVGEAGLVFCSDAGETNFPQVTPPTDSTLFGILSTQGGGMLVFGVAGRAFLSHDGGQSWVRVALNTNANLTAGLVTRSGQIVLGAEDGTLYSGDASGDHFHALSNIRSEPIFAMAETENGGVIAVGNTGVETLCQPAHCLN